MSKKEYIWRIGDSPPPINQHSIAKQEIYKRYINKYIHTLNSNPLIPNSKMVIVDAFAGGGVYLTEDNQHHNGSPIKVIEAVKDAENEINSKRKNQFTIQQRYFFLEKKKSNFDYLVKHLTDLEYGQYFDTEIIIQNGEFEYFYKNIIKNIHSEFSSKVRTIFILDQYGYTDVPFRIIRDIFQHLPNAEIILTLAVNHLIDYICDPEDAVRQTSPGLFEEDKKIIRNSGIELQKTLKETMGLDLKELHDIKSFDPSWRRTIEVKITKELQLFSEAKFYTPFFLSGEESHRDMWLVHLSNHEEARNVMTQVHWGVTNDMKVKMKHYGNLGLDMLGYKDRPKQDSQYDIFSNDVFSFADNAENKVIESIMEETPNNLHGPITFNQFYQENANHTVAHKEQIRESLKNLLKMKELQATGKSGEKRVSDIKNSDIIQLPPQLKIYFR